MGTKVGSEIETKSLFPTWFLTSPFAGLTCSGKVKTWKTDGLMLNSWKQNAVEEGVLAGPSFSNNSTHTSPFLVLSSFILKTKMKISIRGVIRLKWHKNMLYIKLFYRSRGVKYEIPPTYQEPNQISKNI